MDIADLHRGSVRRTILIASPQPEVTRPLTAALTQGGFEVIVGATAADSLTAINGKKPDAAIVGLAFEDSIRLCAALRSRLGRGARLIVLAPTDEPRNRELARKAGANAIFGTPYSPLALRRALEQTSAS